LKPDQLYNLLPAVYRTLDAEQGDQLRGLMAVLQTQFDELQDDITGLYNDWFIETCAEWVVPYIADLLGLEGIEPSVDGQFSQRAFVANTLSYRARKGTVPVIEQIARDLADEPAKATEYFKSLSVTQQMRHIQARRFGVALIRSAWDAHLAHTAFDRSPHFAEVRRIASGRGRYNIPNVGLDLWRSRSYFIERATPFRVEPNHYTFDPLGRDLPLFNRVRSEVDGVVQQADVPEPLAWRPLYDELVAGRSNPTEDIDGVYFGSQPVLQVFVDGVEVDPADIYAAKLDPWRTPTSGVAIDVERGRLAVDPALTGEVQVSFCQGWPGETGALPFDRRRFLPPSDFEGKVVTVPSPLVPTIAAAIASWDPVVDADLLIRIVGNPTFTGDLIIDKPAGRLRIESGNLTRPSLIGNIVLPPASGVSRLELEGILIDGRIRVRSGLGSLTIAACTLVPRAQPSVQVTNSNLELQLEIDRCVSGALSLPRDLGGLTMRDSLVKGTPSGYAIRCDPGTSETNFGPACTIERSTLLGQVSVKQGTLISECIFTDTVRCERVQTGCTRYSFVPFGSRVPRRFHCQPFDRYDELRAALPSPITPLQDAEITKRASQETRPKFVSTDPRSDAFLLLLPNGPCRIATGAEDEGEMGGWHLLYEQRRMRHLNGALADYVRFGLEAGVFLANRH
jgi:hypothetical protein